MRVWVLGLALCVLTPSAAAAEWQVRPFIGFTFGGATTFFDPDDAIRTKNAVVGVSGGWLGEVLGFEADFSRAPGFFQKAPTDLELVVSSSVTAITGNVVVALPRRIAGYGLRPYFVGGAGALNVSLLGRFEAVETNRTLPALSFGGGATGFVNNRVGVNWEVRRLSTLRGEGETMGNSLSRERLSFWRATMALAIRY